MRKNLLLTISVLCLAVIGLRAQGITSSSMDGVVTDQKGESLPGANVVATHLPSGTEYGISSRSDGRFNLNGLRVGGPYTIKVSFVGYKDQTRENIFLELGQTFRIDFKLADQSTELAEIVVSGVQDQILNSEKIGTSTNFSVSQIQRLPSIGRDFRDFTSLTPQASGGNFSFGGRSSLYNNLTIDGATANNVFGLSPIPGGQSNTTPFSLDAIQEVTVQLSPYDLRQGNFTGAGISAVTKSGNNTLAGSAYYFFRNESFAGSKIAGVDSPIPSFNFNNTGFRLGGPIIKNKLFFFVNAEFETRTDPAFTFTARPTGSSPQGATETQASADSDPLTGLEGLKQFLITNYNYNPGVYQNFSRATESQRYVARFDYNINQNHKLTVRGNITNAFQDVPPSGSGGFTGGPAGGRGNTNNVLSFSSSYYRINNNQSSVTAELNSTFKGGLFTNNLVVGYSAFRDFRQDAGGINTPNFPLVDILGPNGQNLTSFGPDPFTPNNKLDQDVTQINDFFSMYLKNHTVTVGTANELYTFNNVFTQVVNGVYRYNSIADFIGDATPSTTALFRPTQYTIQFVGVPGGPSATAAKWSALQMGFFAQDEYTGIKNVKITGGIRVDIPTYLTDLPKNQYVNSLNLQGEQLQVGGWPKVAPLISPRVGFNWDVKGDRTTQVRGGTGLLTGRIPFVWLSNAVSNNGLFFGQTNPTGNAVPFTNNGDGLPYDYSQTPYLAPSELYSNLASGTPQLITNPLDRNFGRPAVTAGINTIAKDFKFPQVWRSNLAIDQKLPGGIVGTLEWIYTKDINAVLIRDANLANPVATVQGDGRPLFGAVGADRAIIANDRRVSGDITQAYVIDNTNKGYQWSVTGQLTKNFSPNFQLSAAYTYTDSREINSQSGSTAGGVFTSQNNVLGPNNSGQSYAATLVPHRIIAYGNYRREYAKHFASTIGFTYIGNSGNNFSYVYGNDLNNDGTNGNDLIYIPRSQSEILLTTTNATDNRSIDQIWQQLDSYINQDAYLSKHRGEYAERNGATSPWVNQLNLSFLQDFYLDVKGRRHTIQLSLNLQNALNLFDSGEGLFKSPTRNQLLNFVGFEQPHTAGSLAQPVANAGPASTIGLPWAATTGRPIFTFATNADGTPLTNSYTPVTSLATNPSSRWQLQFGVRYIF
ncbi:MAG: carboxypeptidase regulatory-like domain-containing protein [Cyclobacteriaceae bacterium]